MNKKYIKKALKEIFSLKDKNEADFDEAMMDFVEKLGWSEEAIDAFYVDFSEDPMKFNDVNKFIIQPL